MKIYHVISELLQQGETMALASIVGRQGSAPRGEGAKMLIRQDGSIFGTIGGGPLEAEVIRQGIQVIRERTNRRLEFNLNKDQAGNLNMQCGGQVEVLIEAIMPPPRLVIAGAGHIGQQLARIASVCEWEILVLDDRRELLTPEILPAGVKGIWGENFPAALEQVAITSNTYLVIVTRDADAQVLEEVILKPAGYIGMIGSRRKIGLVKKQLREKGISEERLNFIHAPIGLNIKAETPGEIAVSIMAELIMVMRGGASVEVTDWGVKNGKE